MSFLDDNKVVPLQLVFKQPNNSFEISKPEKQERNIHKVTLVQTISKLNNNFILTFFKLVASFLIKFNPPKNLKFTVRSPSKLIAKVYV